MNASEIQMIKLEKDVEYTNKKVDQMEKKMDDIERKIDAIHKRFDEWTSKTLNQYVRKDEFIFWRNLIVSGILLSIFVFIITTFVEKLIN